MRQVWIPAVAIRHSRGQGAIHEITLTTFLNERTDRKRLKQTEGKMAKTFDIHLHGVVLASNEVSERWVASDRRTRGNLEFLVREKAPRVLARPSKIGTVNRSA